MPHTLVLEKGRPHPEDVRIPSATPLADSREHFVYMLLPHDGSYQVMRAPLQQLLEICEAVTDMPARQEPTSRTSWIRFGEIEIDGAARVVTRAGRVIPLAPLEFDLLVALVQRKGAAASREELMREIWTGKDGVTSRTVDTHIFNLRRKLEDDPSKPVHLLTVSKIGYRLRT